MCAKYHESDPFASTSFEDLRRFIVESRQRPCGSFEDYERELHRRIQEWEAEVIGAQLAGYDVDEPRIEFEGQAFRNKMKSVKEYHCLSGTFEIERTLYVSATGGGKAICPLEFRAGIVEGCWSPLAARVMAQAVAISTPKDADSGEGGRPIRRKLDSDSDASWTAIPTQGGQAEAHDAGRVGM